MLPSRVACFINLFGASRGCYISLTVRLRIKLFIHSDRVHPEEVRGLPTVICVPIMATSAFRDQPAKVANRR